MNRVMLFLLMLGLSLAPVLCLRPNRMLAKLLLLLQNRRCRRSQCPHRNPYRSLNLRRKQFPVPSPTHCPSQGTTTPPYSKQPRTNESRC